LVLLAGVSPHWFMDPKGIAVKKLPTYFGKLDMQWKKTTSGAILKLGSQLQPPGGYILRLPSSLRAQLTIAGKSVKADSFGNLLLPKETRRVRLGFK
jgi:hypothetical protein